MTRRATYIDIIRLGLPILVGQLGMIVVGFADTTMVGRYSTDALASASFVNNIFNAAVFACVGFTYGITPLAGALFGQKRLEEVGFTLRVALIINLLFSMLISGLMLVVYFNIHRLGQPPHLLPIIRPYFLIFLAGLIPIALFNAFAQWAYSIGRTKMPMWIILAGNLINVSGNYLLIYGQCGLPEMGLTGAGWATFAARLFCLLLIAAVFFLKADYAPYRIGFHLNRPSSPALRNLNRTSWPVALQMSFESGSFSAAAIMAGWIGAIPLAAFQVIVITGTLGFCVYYSMAAAVAVLVANASGTDNRPAMRQIAFSGYHILLALALIASLTFLFAGQPIISIFTEDPAVVAAALSLIFPLILYQLGDATQITFANALRGTGNVLPMLWISFVSYIIIGIPATYILAFPCGLATFGIILSFSVSLFIAAALFLHFFLRTTAPLGKKV